MKSKDGTPLRPEDILALDMADHCGYYSKHGSGTWDFTPAMSRNQNKPRTAFKNTIVDFIRRNNIKQVVAEDVSVGTNFTAVRKLGGYHFGLELICEELDLPAPSFVNVTTLKRWATGDGKADKRMMIAYCKKRWGINPIDDNEADAAHIFMYYCLNRM